MSLISIQSSSAEGNTFVGGGGGVRGAGRKECFGKKRLEDTLQEQLIFQTGQGAVRGLCRQKRAALLGI